MISVNQHTRKLNKNKPTNMVKKKKKKKKKTSPNEQFIHFIALARM
jgi:hypothetical protein